MFPYDLDPGPSMLQPTYDAIDRPNAQLRTSHPVQGAVGPAPNPIEIGAIVYVLSCASLTKFAKIECKSPGPRALLITPSTLPLSQAFLSLVMLLDSQDYFNTYRFVF